MSGTWTSQNKILPGAYINFLTNAPLSISLGERGVVVLLQEMNVGTVGEMYTVTATENNYPSGITAADKLLASEALKGARTVIVYNLGTSHTATVLETALGKLKQFNLIPYAILMMERNIAANKNHTCYLD